MFPRVFMLMRDLYGTTLGSVICRVFAVALPMLLAMVAVGFLVAAGYGVLAEEFGAPAAALSFAALFAILAFAAVLAGRTAVLRRELRAAEARIELARELAEIRTSLSVRGNITPLTAFLAAFALARRSR